MLMVSPTKEELKRQLESEHPEWKEPKLMPKPLASVVQDMLQEQATPREEYAKDPWWIVRVEPNAYATAENSLQREGFEFYTPTFKVLRPMPLRLIPPKKRHQSNLYKQEVRRRRFDGYAFVRRMFGTYDVNRLFDLDGCGAIVKAGDRYAVVYDYEIELMRSAEATGLMDQVEVETYRGYKVSRIEDDQRWTGESKVIGRLDESDRTILFVQRMGRIARLIAEADPKGVTLGAKL